MELISRQEAIAKGLSYYCTGIPCIHGHVGRRRVIQGSCLECIREKQKANKKQKHRAERAKIREKLAAARATPPS